MCRFPPPLTELFSFHEGFAFSTSQFGIVISRSFRFPPLEFIVRYEYPRDSCFRLVFSEVFVILGHFSIRWAYGPFHSFVLSEEGLMR